MSVAADELFRVASAISYTVNQFEDELDDRSKPKAEFSTDGYMINVLGQLILKAPDELAHKARQSAKRGRGSAGLHR